jgi:hypothetical protein
MALKNVEAFLFNVQLVRLTAFDRLNMQCLGEYCQQFLLSDEK